MECRECRFVYVSDPPEDRLRHAGEYHAARVEAEDPVAATADAVGFLAYWSAKLSWPAGLTLLDVGCAEGRLLAVARCMGYCAEGLDITDHYVTTWARSCLSATVETPEGHSASREQAYDVVIARQVIEHVRDPLSFLRACATMLKPGGACLIETGDPGSWQARYERQRWNYWIPVEGAGKHISFINRRAAAVLGQRAGIALRDSLPQMRYVSALSYARQQGRRRLDLRTLSKFVLHQSRLSAARCYWYERPHTSAGAAPAASRPTVPE